MANKIKLSWQNSLIWLKWPKFKKFLTIPRPGENSIILIFPWRVAILIFLSVWSFGHSWTSATLVITEHICKNPLQEQTLEIAKWLYKEEHFLIALIQIVDRWEIIMRKELSKFKKISCSAVSVFSTSLIFSLENVRGSALKAAR